MRLSEERDLYNNFMSEIIALLEKDNLPLVAKMIRVILADTKSSSDVQLAFSNVLWKLDERYDANMKGELENILKMIPVIADPKDDNTIKIMGTIRELIEAENEVTETLTQEEIDAELADMDEDDNSPPDGLNLSTLIN